MLDIKVQLDPTTVLALLVEEYGGRGVGWEGKGRKTILGMGWVFWRFEAQIWQQGQSAGQVSVKGV